MKDLFVALFISSILGLNLLLAQDAPQTEKPRDGIFIHITESYDNPHRLLMPLKMATIMAEDKDVLVYMDIDAVKVLVKGALDVSHPEFESALTYILQLSKMGVGIYACPTCLKVSGYSTDDLMEGILVANKDRFFDFTKGRILSLDY